MNLDQMVEALTWEKRLRQSTELQRGVIYVTRRVNGVDVPLIIWNQLAYREWLGCWSAI
jgi:hypothetical protein